MFCFTLPRFQDTADVKTQECSHMSYIGRLLLRFDEEQEYFRTTSGQNRMGSGDLYEHIRHPDGF